MRITRWIRSKLEESRKALFFLLFLGVIDVIRYFAASRDVTNLYKVKLMKLKIG